jgi:hypothetical protein
VLRSIRARTGAARSLEALRQDLQTALTRLSHLVTVRRIGKNRLKIGPIETIDHTPVVDIKPTLSGVPDF